MSYLKYGQKTVRKKIQGKLPASYCVSAGYSKDEVWNEGLERLRKSFESALTGSTLSLTTCVAYCMILWNIFQGHFARLRTV